MKPKYILIGGISALWLGTLVAAYHLGKSPTPADDGSPVSSGSGPASPAGIPGRTGLLKAVGSSPSWEPGGTPLTVKQILAKAKTAMQGGGMQNPRAMMKAMALIEGILPEDLPAALAEMEKVTDPQQKMMLQMSLLGKWAELDGPAAMKYAEDHASGAGMMAQMGKMAVASTWSEKDPEAVWKWYQDQDGADSGGMFGSNMVLASLFANMAARDPDMAFKRLETIEGSERIMAVSGLLQAGMFDEEKRKLIFKKVDTIPDETERKQARQMMLSQLTMTAPDQAIEWMKSQPESEQGPMRETVGAMLMMSDPKKGASFMLEGASDEEKPKRIATVVEGWANLDINAAGTWLKEQPQGPQLDKAREAFVRAASQKDPESAIVWAGTITDPPARVNSTTTAYQAWKKKDPAAAERALNASGLSSAQKDSVRTASPTPESLELPSPAIPTMIKEQ